MPKAGALALEPAGDGMRKGGKAEKTRQTKTMTLTSEEEGMDLNDQSKRLPPICQEEFQYSESLNRITRE